jgi:hypothetical protein
VKKLLLLVPLMMLLGGCPPPRYVQVYNNTGAALFVYGQNGTTEVDVGKSKNIPFPQFIHHSWSEGSESRFFIWLKVGWKVREYQVEQSGWFKLGSRMELNQHVQVEATGDILFLEDGVSSPAPVDLPQPAGFPLQGKIPDWVEKK